MIESKSLNLAKKFLGKEVEVVFDRPLGSKHPKHGFVYEVNYGYLDGVKATDGEDRDVRSNKNTPETDFLGRPTSRRRVL